MRKLHSNENWVLYDGSCPFCKNYVAVQNLKYNIGQISVINAREQTKELNEAVSAGYDLDEGMLLKLHGKYYFGSDCMHMIAILSGNSGLSAKLVNFIMKNQSIAGFLYPILKLGRATVLTFLRIPKINNNQWK